MGDMTRIDWERNYHLAWGAAALATYAIFVRKPVAPSSAANLLTAVMTISSIAAGFIGTSQSNLLSIRDTDLLKFLRESGTYERIIRYSMSGIYWAIGLAVVSGGLLLVDPKITAWWTICLWGTWIFLMGTSGGACHRIIRLMGEILRSDLG
jgi:hypothetical protein